MEYRRYHQSDVSVDSDNGDVKYRRYIESEQKRFLEFVEGTLTEILPSDFPENMTVLRGYAICGFSNLSYIELPESITTIETDAFAYIENEAGLTIVFPSNLTKIGMFEHIDSDANVIMDFSKAKKVPSAIEVNSNSTADIGVLPGVTTIKVPQSLYSAWIATEGWYVTSIIERIVAV